MTADFIYVFCPQCKEPFRTTAGAAKERIPQLMPVLRLVRARCPHCGAKMSVGDAQIRPTDLKAAS